MAVGFGIKTPEGAAQAARVAAAAAGSALVEEAAGAIGANQPVVPKVLGEVAALAEAACFARVAAQA